jgi:hypothetical protein
MSFMDVICVGKLINFQHVREVSPNTQHSDTVSGIVWSKCLSRFQTFETTGRFLPYFL